MLKRICGVLATALASVLSLSALADAFDVPLDTLKKIETANVVRFVTQPSGKDFLMSTRGGFKIYAKGLEFSDPDSAFSLVFKAQALPVAQSVMDPFYNELRDVHGDGTLFHIADSALTNHVAIRFEACSLTNCLLPAVFKVSTRPGSVGGFLRFAKNESEPQLPLSTATSLPNLDQTAPEKDAISIKDNLSLQVDKHLRARSVWLFPLLFLAGLLMNLTPCVYPMIPITLNVISRYSTYHKRLMPFLYVAGMILAYSAMGVVAGMTGTLFGALLQSSAVNLFLFALMFTFGLTMLGVFDVSFLQKLGAKIAGPSRFPKTSVVVMGVVSGLVSAPCTGPVLSTLLIVISQSKDPIYGFTLMIFYALGFGFPYLILGFVTQKIFKVPKLGGTLTYVKFLFSALMFGLSFYYLKNIIGHWNSFNVLYSRPAGVGVVCVALIAVIFLQLRRAHSGLYKRIGTTALIVSLSLLSLWGTLYITNGFVASASVVDTVANRKNAAIKWESSFEFAKDRALSENKPLLVDVWAQWCTACLIMDAGVWADADVIANVNEFYVAVKLDFTKPSNAMDQLVAQWDLSGLPAIGIFEKGADYNKNPQHLFRQAITAAEFHEIQGKIFK